MRLALDQLPRSFLSDDEPRRNRVVCRRQMDLHAAQLRRLQTQVKISLARAVYDARLSDESTDRSARPPARSFVDYSTQ